MTHAIYLTDDDGIVLRSYGDRAMIEALGLTPGYDWSESQMGTNGAGTALTEGQPGQQSAAAGESESPHRARR